MSVEHPSPSPPEDTPPGDAPPPPTRTTPRPSKGGRRRALRTVVGIVASSVVAAACGQALYVRATSRPLPAPLADAPAEVTCVTAERASYRPVTRYVGTIEPWLAASVGPQLVAAYVTDVRVRPGAEVSRGDVLATLDCRESRASARAMHEEARAVQAQEQALSRQAERTSALLAGGFVAENDVDLRTASSEHEHLHRVATEAEASRSTLYVGDCTLRAPFDGEIDVRSTDPGAFVAPGDVVVGVVDRTRVRVVADVPETALGDVAPGMAVDVHVLSTGVTVPATVTRRAPAADPVSRTVRIEIDLPNDDRSIPVRTTAEILVRAREGTDAISLPLAAARVVGARARVWVVDGEVARPRTLRVVGEDGDALFVAPQIEDGTSVVLEGREALGDGTRVHVGRTLERAEVRGEGSEPG